MNIFTYIKSLAHKFNKTEIQKSCETTIDSLRNHTIPAYAGAMDLFKSSKFKSKEALDFATTLKRMVKGSSNSLLETIHDCLIESTVLLKVISKKSDHLFNDQESTLALTFQKATYLRLVTAIGFTNDFSRKFLNYLYVLETANVDKEFSIKESITPAEIKYVEDNFLNFCTCVNILTNKTSAIEQKVDDLPDALVTETSEKTLEAVLGNSKVDPLGFRNFALPVNISVRWNPFYMVANLVADYQIAAYKCAKEEFNLLQLRKLNLERLNEKKPDAKLQQEIEHMSNRISGLNFEITQMESKYA